MQWIRAHKYTVAFIAMSVLVIVGGVMAKNNTGTGIERTGVENIPVEYPYYAPLISENGAGTIAGQNPQTGEANASDPAPRVLFSFGGEPASGGFGNIVSAPKEIPAAIYAPNRMPPATAEKESAKAEGTSFNNAYLPFFQKLANALSQTDARTPEQKTLFAYGNALGSMITAFENTHSDVVQTLKTFFDSRIDPAKAAGIPEIAEAYAQLTAARSGAIPSGSGADAAANLRTVADEYAKLGATIASLQNIPQEAETLNAKLAEGYAGAAQGLARLSTSEGETQLLDAIYEYNAGADEFIKNYAALVQLFSAYGVKFGTDDPGAIFSFSATGGL